MVFTRARFPHVLLDLFSSLLPQSSCTLGHREQAKIILCNQKYVESVEFHGKWDITEDPL